MKLPSRALFVGTFFSAIFAALAIYASNKSGIALPATQISSIAILFCLIIVVALNPVLNLVGLRIFDRKEVFLIFIMGIVPAGIPIYGLVSQTLPMMGALHNPNLNTVQSEWDSTVTPNLDRNLFIGDAIFTAQEVKDWPAFSAYLASGGSAEANSIRTKIWNGVSADTQKLLLNSANLNDNNKITIADNIRMLLIRENLFGLTDLPQEDRSESFEQSLNGLSKKEHTKRINRYVFESTYRQYLHGNKFLRDQHAILDYTQGLKRHGINAWPTSKNPYGNVPWSSWKGPLLKMLLIVSCIFLMFYALNEIVFKQWYEREKLIFPIAEFGSVLLTSEDAPDGGYRIPSVFRSPAFWVGFSISFFILLYNGLVSSQVLEGMRQIDLSCRINQQLVGTVFEGLNPHFRTEIFFACIGLAFLLPLEISFSIWFFYLFMMTQQLGAVWMGHGDNSLSFSQDWTETASFMTAQGGGAMEAFGLFCLWKVRHYFLAFIYRLLKPGGSGKITTEEIRKFTIPSILFFISSVGIFYFLRKAGVAWGICIVTYFVWLMITVSMVRLVAECGLIAVHAWFGPIHFLKVFGLLKYPVLFATKGIGTVMMLTVGIFTDLKTFIAPTMINAKYLSVKHKIPNRSFIFACIIGITVTLVISTAIVLFMTYDNGVGAMEGWYFSRSPVNTMKTIKRVTTLVAGNQSMATDKASWFGFGAILCSLLIYGRQFISWLPHPIGYLMFANPLMAAHWFSFLVAWVCKRSAIKYCDADGYKSVRAGFIGLIMGEIAIVGISLLLTVLFGVNMGISLDR